jgi:hypothetical protein
VLLLQGDNHLVLFTTIELGIPIITPGIMLLLNVLVDPSVGPFFPEKDPCTFLGLCNVASVKRAAIGSVDPWLSWTVSLTTDNAQGTLAIIVVTNQVHPNSPYTKLGLFVLMPGIPFAVVQVAIAPTGVLDCLPVPMTIPGAGIQLTICTFLQTPTSVSFNLLGPAPDRLMPSGATGPVSVPKTLDETFLATLQPAPPPPPAPSPV